MTKLQVFLLGVILTLSALWPFFSPVYYAPLVIMLGWYSLAVFPLTAGAISLVILYFFEDAAITLDLLIQKVRNRQSRKLLMKLFEKGRIVALIGSAFLFCPFVIPIIAKICIKQKKNLYIATTVLNIIMVFVWNCVYMVGWGMIRDILNLN